MWLMKIQWCKVIVVIVLLLHYNYLRTLVTSYFSDIHYNIVKHTQTTLALFYTQAIFKHFPLLLLVHFHVNIVILLVKCKCRVNTCFLCQHITTTLRHCYKTDTLYQCFSNGGTCRLPLGYSEVLQGVLEKKWKTFILLLLMNDGKWGRWRQMFAALPPIA